MCEPPGDPYYLARIMEFSHEGNDPSRRVDSLRINWYYRPKDIGRKVQDTRLVIATMHSDYSPLTALRGKCTIRHRHEIKNMEAYRRMPDSFWYEKLYDRYIQKNFDLIPTSTIINVPDKVKKVLHDRWKFVLVEQGNRGKELTSAVKLCKRCSAYCARYVPFALCPGLPLDLSPCHHPTRQPPVPTSHPCKSSRPHRLAGETTECHLHAVSMRC